MTLRQMALQKQLPRHQCMDRETLDWIKARAFSKGLSLSPYICVPSLIINLSYLAQPAPHFFTSEEIYVGLHGWKHCFRVAILAALTCLEAGIKNKTTIRAAMIAGSLHDCRRENDNADKGHGIRSAEWFKNSIDIVNNHYGVELSRAEIELIDVAIRFHETNDVPAEFDQQFISVVKTADALDRYRQPKEKWWISENYLILKPSFELKSKAFNLMYVLEDAFLQTGTVNDSLRLIQHKLSNA